ncbi:MAG: hypothetical protein ABR501_14660 [Pyrinomonadaceae bacterium]
MQIKKFAIAILTVLFLIPQTTWAKTIRVKFPAGRSTVVLKGKTTGGPSESGGMDPVNYQLRARKGQQMTLHLTSAKKNAVFAIYLPGMDLLETPRQTSDSHSGARDWKGTLPKSGIYEIIVFPEDEATDTSFTLEITIR